MNVKSAAEDVWEADDIVDLIRIVGATGRHQYIGTTSHGILIANFWNRIGQCKYDWLLGHGADHILGQYVAF